MIETEIPSIHVKIVTLKRYPKLRMQHYKFTMLNKNATERGHFKTRHGDQNYLVRKRKKMH